MRCLTASLCVCWLMRGGLKRALVLLLTNADDTCDDNTAGKHALQYSNMLGPYCIQILKPLLPLLCSMLCSSGC